MEAQLGVAKETAVKGDLKQGWFVGGGIQNHLIIVPRKPHFTKANTSNVGKNHSSGQVEALMSKEWKEAMVEIAQGAGQNSRF